MSDNSAIEWTDATWNPVRGCTKISPGCKHCYAATFAERWRGIPGHAYEQGFDLRLVPEKLDEPLRWKTPRRVFVNSMSDLFHDGVPVDFIAEVFDRMACATVDCKRRHEHVDECWTGEPHTFQVLTKRAERMRRVVTDEMPSFVAEHFSGDRPLPVAMEVGAYPLRNVWLGVSVEDRKHGLPRIEHLRKTPAAVRFLSIEPLLEDLGELDLRGIGWVIVGGESGPGARRCDLTWLRSLVQQCAQAGVPCFVKQTGAAPVLDGFRPTKPGTAVADTLFRIRDRKGGDPSEWPADLRVRQFPEVRHAG